MYLLLKYSFLNFSIVCGKLTSSIWKKSSKCANGRVLHKRKKKILKVVIEIFDSSCF